MDGSDLMKNKLVFIFAIIFGFITVFLIMSYLNNARKALDDTVYVQIVVAKEDISAKKLINENMIEKKTIPLKYKHEKEIEKGEDVLGKITLIPIYKGESILDNQITGESNNKDGLSYNIPQGKRAMTVAVDNVSGLEGLIKTDDRVDVVTAIEIGEKPPVYYTVVVLQDILVLAVGKNFETPMENNEKKQDEIKTVTLSVSLEESLKLKMASHRGSISLILRSPIDDSKSSPLPFAAEDFLK